MATEYVSAKMAAAMIGKTPRRVNQMLIEGGLTGMRIGNSNAVTVKSLDRYLRKHGKPTSNGRAGRKGAQGK